MSRRNAERAARYAEMFPAATLLASSQCHPTQDEQRVFDEYAMSPDARAVAMHSARQHRERAAALYRMIAATRGPWRAGGA